MKLKRLFWASILLVVLTSCASKPFPVPGDTQKERENIYNEYMVIADAYFELEKFDKAITYYKLCMEKKSLYWASFYKLAKAYVMQGNWGEAQKMYEVILERDKDNSTIKASLAYIYSMTGESKKAIEIYNELLKEQPKNQQYLENYIAIQLLSKDLTDVDAPLSALMNDFPDSENIAKFQKQIDSILDEREKEKAAVEAEKEEADKETKNKDTEKESKKD